MSKFLEISFPQTIASEAVGGPAFDTRITEDILGREERQATWSFPRSRWTVGHWIGDKDKLDTLIEFFRVVRGPLYGFRFKDWTDYQATGQTLSAIEGSSTEFQLSKTYGYGGESVTRDIKKPVSGTVVVYDNGAQQGSGWSVDTTTGIITFSSAPAGPVTADFEFDVPARFETEALEASVTILTVGRWDGIRIIELID